MNGLGVMFGFTVLGCSLALAAPGVPLDLPRPDGEPGNPAKPVKVYILAGQSNMVGMGDMTGARPLYPSVYLSADPAIIPGVMPIGGSALAAHRIFQSAESGAEAGAMVALHKGVYDAGTDYARLTSVKTATVALGTMSAVLPALDGPHTAVVTAFIEVPATGSYTLHAGFGDSTHAVVSLDGKDVYRKAIGDRLPAITKVTLDAGRRYPVSITYLRGGSAAFWLEQVDLAGRGDLVSLTKKEGKFPYLLDDDGNWTQRTDVIYTDPRLFPTRPGAPLSATSNNGKSIGPELGFGSVIGNFHDEPVLLIKTANGNRSLNWDFRPPSSGKSDAPGADKWEGLEYRLMVEGVRESLAKIDTLVPGYAGQGYEIAGFCWWQGHKDAGISKADYEAHLVNLINDLRTEFKAPALRAVVATVGFGGYRLYDQYKPVWEAQMAVGDPAQHPEFAGTVASVDIRDFWREVEESPRGQDYHYNRNPETYLLVGEAMGRAMVRLLGGEAEAIPLSDRQAGTAARVAAEAARPVPTDEQKAASLAATRPMVLDGALVSFLNDPRNQAALPQAVKGEKPAKPDSILEDVLDGVADYYRAVGVRDYDWTPFGGNLREADWNYYSLDLPAGHDKARGIRDLAMIAPAEMTNWYAIDFDAKRAGWPTGIGPFGTAEDTVTYPEWFKRSRRWEPNTVCERDVLLLRQTFELPALRDGYRYRIRVFGSVHPNCGEGFAVYVNGRLLAVSLSGITAWRKQGGRPRGGHILADFREVFGGGAVTLAVGNFPMNNQPTAGFLPARAPLSIWMEEMRIPEVVNPY